MPAEGRNGRHRAGPPPPPAPPFAGLAAAAVAFVVLYVLLSGTGVLGATASVVVDDLGQLIGGAAATVAFTLTARRRPRGDRTWRVLLALATGGWTAGMLVWAWYQVFVGEELPSPSLADVGFFALPVFALPALLVLPSTPARNMRGRTSPRALLVTDTTIVVGSLFLLTWSTALGATIDARPADTAMFLVALGYAVTDLAMVVFVVLMGTFRRPRNPAAVLLLGLGLVAFCVSDSFYLYLVSTGHESMPPLYNIGFVAGPVLTTLAAVVPDGTGGLAEDLSGRGSERATVILPCLPVVAMLLLLIGHQLAGVPVDRFEGAVGTLLVTAVVIRQLVTSLDNVTLLHQVRDGQERLRRQAFTDDLTGLANRALFAERLVEAIRAHAEDQAPFAVVFCDLDDFKQVNDEHGHAAGDTVLRQVADRLRATTAPGDTAARLGGDEFALLLDGNPARGADVGGHVVSAIEAAFTVGTSRHRSVLSIGTSVGVVTVGASEPPVTADALLSRADAAMYRAKQAGKHRMVVVASAAPTDVNNPAVAAGVLGDLRLALASPPLGEGRIDVVYQPIVRIDDESVVAVEALVRFDHARLGATSAEALVIAAEDNGLIGALEAQVLETAARDLAHLRAQPGRSALRVHVNLSGRGAGDADLPDRVAALLARHGLPPSALVLELTETSRIPDLDAAREVLAQVRALGVGLALDDFGTGFSGVSYLVELPVEVLKLDRVLTAAAEGSRAATVRDAAVRLALDLGLDIVAEGVQTRAEAQALARIGCQFAQGYLYAPPGPVTPALAGRDDRALSDA